MSKRNQLFKLKDININKENFRHSPLDSEIEAIHYLIEEDYESYLNLAKTMAKDCRSYTALILKKNNQYILMDGNRRTSILKIFDNPDLIPQNPKYNSLRKLCIEHGPLNITEIFADVYFEDNIDDKNNLMEALNELHIHDNKTKKDWNALSQYRASEYIGTKIKHAWIKTLLYYNYTDDEIIKMTKNKTDIFNRIFIKSILKIDETGKINLSNDLNLLKEICKVVKNKAYYIHGEIKKIDTRTNKEVYYEVLQDLIDNICIKQSKIIFEDITSSFNNNCENVTPEVKHIDSLMPNESDKFSLKTENSFTAKFKQPKSRKNIISYEQRAELNIPSNMNVNQIANELFSLNISAYPISSAIVLRSFLQYSFVWYVNYNNIQINHNNLAGIINKINNDFFVEKKITKEEKIKLKMMLENNNIIILLNDVTHNYQSSLIPQTLLIDLYDSIHPLIKIIYKN